MKFRVARHQPFFVAALALIAVGLISLRWVDEGFATIFAINSFFIVYLAMTIVRVPQLNEAFLRTHPGNADAPVMVIFLITLATVATAFAALFEVVNSAKDPMGWRLAFALAAIPLGWATIHLMAAIHYAHLFWEPHGKDAKPGIAISWHERARRLGFCLFRFCHRHDRANL